MNSESKNFENHTSVLCSFFLMSLVENQNILNTLPNGEFGIFLKDLILKIERAAGEMV